jgi:tetratricopeptide (TPR) repeat protein
MVRWIPVLLMASAAFAGAQQAPEKAPPKQLEKERQKPAAGAKEEIPPEEDATQGVVEYSFNPLQSTKDVNVGNQYFKNHKFRAAEMRYTSATKWNDGNAEAWLRLGEVAERLKDADKAKEAYKKYLELASDAKNASEIKKRLEKLK